MFKKFFLLALALPACTAQPSYKISDHFNGKRFYNPVRTEHPKFGAMAKFLINGRSKNWPKSIVQKPKKLNLSQKIAPGQVALTYVNHACFLLQFTGGAVLTDPMWSKRAGPYNLVGPKRAILPGVSFDELPKIDAVVVSHNHYDHMDLATLRRLYKKCAPKIFVPLGNKKFLENNGIGNVTELDWWQEAIVNADLKIQMVPARHFSARTPWDRDATLWASYAIRTGLGYVYFSGDTSYGPHFKQTREKLGAPALALLPIGAYEPRAIMKDYHVNPQEAAQAHLDLKARRSVGMHFGTFNLTQDKIDEPPQALQKAMHDLNIDANDFITVQEGVTHLQDLR